ncbi:MAG: ABC transporter permease [Bryobacterales bacterium]|nr:ABC transporter permease [Bryobacterales bacterium]
MRRSTLLWRNLTYHWRTNLAVIFGVATAVAVLAGALLVGDSVRGSLRELVVGRLGKTDYVVAGMNPFRAGLAGELAAQRAAGLRAYPMFAIEGIATHAASGRAAKVAVYGVDDGFWKFHGVHLAREAPAGRTVLVSPSLAGEMEIKPGDAVVLRLDKPSEIPIESLHGRKDDVVRSLRLTAGGVLPEEGMGEFSLRPSQAGVRAVFVSLARLQRELGQAGKANVILLSSSGVLPAGRLSQLVRQRATLEDLGVRVKALSDVRQLSVETASMVVNDSLAAAGEAAARELNLTVQPVLTYLVNSMQAGGRELPYSLVTALDLKLVGGQEGVVLNDWAARELRAKPGDTLEMEYYVWLPEGRLSTARTRMKVSAITPIRGAAADRDYTPEYPGITEAKTIHDWDPPFPMDLGKIRKRDEDYWDNYRTTPKAFVSLQEGQALWGTRFGKLTSLRIVAPADGDLEALRARFEQSLRRKLTPAAMGVMAAPVRQEGLSAAAGSTDFGEYFLYFSFFLVVSALLLVGLFFRLGVEQRYREAGLLRAVGFSVKQIGYMLLREGLALAGIGSAVGAMAAALYAGLVLYGLRTWWMDAVGTKLLRLHVGAEALAGGALGGLATALVVVWLTARGLRKPSPRALLEGAGETGASSTAGPLWAKWLAVSCGIPGAGMLGASVAGKMDAAGGFFGAGAMFLIAALAYERVWLSRGVVNPETVWRLGLRNATYRPGRSVLSMALIGFATFLIIALSAFRQEGSGAAPPGAGGFALVGESVLPLIYNPGTASGRQELGFPDDAERLFAGVRIVPLRMRPGDDASCLTLYQPRNPRVLALPDEALFRMPLSAEKIAPKAGQIAAFADANSLEYVLHRKVGDEIALEGGEGKPVRLVIAGTIHDSIFQSEVVIREADFAKAFPEQQGFRMFLVEAPAGKAREVASMMEERLSDYGLDLQSTAERLAEYHKVENAYLSTFQALGGLGLLLGTAGLAAVLLRNVLERRKELALLRAVGYQPSQLAALVLAENVLLLAGGLAIGTLCAGLAIMPAVMERGGKLPLLGMAGMVAAVGMTGLFASVMAVKAAMRSPLMEALRAE